jgi:hypothetical protein
VDEDGTLSFSLGKFLRDGQLSVEVINGGAPGTTIVDPLLFLRRGIALRPDIVILTFSVRKRCSALPGISSGGSAQARHTAGFPLPSP